MRTFLAPTALLAALAGCGDNGSAPSDAAAIDARADAAIDAPADAPSSCDYTEQHDATNDITAGGTDEASQLTLGARTVVCGTFDSSHFDGDITVDVDAFTFTVASDTTVLLRLAGDASSIELAGVDINAGPTFATLAGTATWYASHGVASVHLAPGTYELVPFALSSAAIAADVAYTVELVPDDPQRCPAVAAGGYAETSDGANSTGNDVFAIPSGAPIALTPSNADAAEATGLAIAPGAATRITGSAADIAMADQYEDRDTYTIQVAPGANELSVRLDWTGTANLDVLLFEGTATTPETRALSTSGTGEQLLYAVKPSTPYQLVIAARPGATFPVAYRASLCSAAYAP